MRITNTKGQTKTLDKNGAHSFTYHQIFALFRNRLLKETMKNVEFNWNLVFRLLLHLLSGNADRYKNFEWNRVFPLKPTFKKYFAMLELEKRFLRQTLKLYVMIWNLSLRTLHRCNQAIQRGECCSNVSHNILCHLWLYKFLLVAFYTFNQNSSSPFRQGALSVPDAQAHGPRNKKIVKKVKL